MTIPGVAVLGGPGGGQNWKPIFEKTRVGFGRTELSLSAIGTTVCALSSGPGPRGQGFEEFSKTFEIHDFCSGVKDTTTKKNMKMQDEHGQILVSRALDPRKMISPKILKYLACFRPNTNQSLRESYFLFC